MRLSMRAELDSWYLILERIYEHHSLPETTENAKLHFFWQHFSERPHFDEMFQAV